MQMTNTKQLAGEIIEYSREQSFIHLRFLDRALYRMSVVHDDKTVFMSTDMRRIYINADDVIYNFKREQAFITRSYLHMVLHCVFKHPYSYEDMDVEAWDIACDLAVEASIMGLGIPSLKLSTDEALKLRLDRMRFSLSLLTAEKIYRHLKDNEAELDFFKNNTALYKRDSHNMWVESAESEHTDRRTLSYNPDALTANIGCHDAEENTGDSEKFEELDEVLIGNGTADWEDIGQRALTDIEMFSEGKGYGAGDLILNIKNVLRKKEDLGEFLKKFAVLGEEMHINQDEFDYIYYTYGLDMYKDMPLIEPLEYRENKRIREFVIAIDTSGSCQGEMVHRFLNKAYSVLKNEGSYFEQINIHIIQCDCRIQEDVKITSDEEFDRYMEDIQLKGFGGTDFRPVFEHVDMLIKRNEFTDLKGLIYFTDGDGTYPETMPDYRVAFIFVDDTMHVPKVPTWAIRLVLHENEVGGRIK